MLSIAFVGQCHTVGYPGVPPDVAFPRVCREVIQAARPDQQVEILLQPYYHPSELEAAVRAIVPKAPRVVIIEVVGWLAVTGTRAVDLSRLPKGIRTTYERVRHFRHVSRLAVSAVPGGADAVWRAQKGLAYVAGHMLKAIVPRYPRPTVEEYETCVADALALIPSTITPVIQGPGAPNLDLNARGIASDAMERYRAVNAMARRVAESHKALFVDRWDTVTRGFYNDGSFRPSADGHSVWGHLLADSLLAAGVV